MLPKRPICLNPDCPEGMPEYSDLSRNLSGLTCHLCQKPMWHVVNHPPAEIRRPKEEA